MVLRHLTCLPAVTWLHTVRILGRPIDRRPRNYHDVITAWRQIVYSQLHHELANSGSDCAEMRPRHTQTTSGSQCLHAPGCGYKVVRGLVDDWALCFMPGSLDVKRLCDNTCVTAPHLRHVLLNAVGLQKSLCGICRPIDWTWGRGEVINACCVTWLRRCAAKTMCIVARAADFPFPSPVEYAIEDRIFHRRRKWIVS